MKLRLIYSLIGLFICVNGTTSGADVSIAASVNTTFNVNLPATTDSTWSSPIIDYPVVSLQPGTDKTVLTFKAISDGSTTVTVPNANKDGSKGKPYVIDIIVAQ